MCALKIREFIVPKKSSKISEAIKAHWECPFCKVIVRTRVVRSGCSRRTFFLQVDWGQVVIGAKGTLAQEDSFALKKSKGLKKMLYDQEIDAYFETEDALRYFTKLRSLYCTLCPHEDVRRMRWFATQRDLDRHLEKSHHRYMCEACLVTQKVFIADREVFTQAQLVSIFFFVCTYFVKSPLDLQVNHYKNGSLATIDRGPIPPHPFCQFCSKPHYSDDELFAHLTSEHKSCDFCHQKGLQKYFRNTSALNRHFNESHFVCHTSPCSDGNGRDSLVAFDDELDLKAHQMQVHSKALSRSQKKNLQKVDLGFFGGHSDGVGDRRRGGRKEEAQEISLHSEETDGDGEFGIEDYEDEEEDAFPDLNAASVAARARVNNQTSSKDDSQKRNSHQQQRGTGRPMPFAGTPFSAPDGPSAYAGSVRTSSQADFPALGSSSSRPQAFPPATRGGAPSAAYAAGGSFPLPSSSNDFPSFPSSKRATSDRGKLQKGKLRAKNPGRAVKTFHTTPAYSPPRVAVDVKEWTVARPSHNMHSSSSERATSRPSSQPSASSSLSNVSTSSPPQSSSSVQQWFEPLPLPPPCPASQIVSRNKLLIVDIKSSLAAPADFATFRSQSAAFQKAEIDAMAYLLVFNQLVQSKASSREAESMLMTLIS